MSLDTETSPEGGATKIASSDTGTAEDSRVVCLSCRAHREQDWLDLLGCWVWIGPVAPRGGVPVGAQGGVMTPDEALALALELGAAGEPAFPIAISWGDGKGKCNKRPLNKHGHYEASTDPDDIKAERAEPAQ